MATCAVPSTPASTCVAFIGGFGAHRQLVVVVDIVVVVVVVVVVIVVVNVCDDVRDGGGGHHGEGQETSYRENALLANFTIMQKSNICL